MGIPYAEVIGDPISHSKSPMIHRFWLEKLGIEADYRPVLVTPDELPSYLPSRRADPDWRGCNITRPHKERIWDLIGYAARFGHSGSVNCLVRGEGDWDGHNFDVDALMRTLPAQARHGRITIIGAGGAARAAVEATASFEVPISLIARDSGRARQLLDDNGVSSPHVAPFPRAIAAMRDCVGVINATPLGMFGVAEMPDTVLDGLAGLRRGSFVYDMVYDPCETPLLRRAKAMSLVAINGFSMLVEQAALSFRHFFDASAPREHDAELFALLTQ